MMDQIGEVLARDDPAKAQEFERWQSMVTGVSDGRVRFKIFAEGG